MIKHSHEKPLNVEEAAEFLDLSKSHIYKLSSRGEIPHYKPTGKRLYFLKEDLIDFLKAGKVKTNREIEKEIA